jgi:perosamine synthetase
MVGSVEILAIDGGMPLRSAAMPPRLAFGAEELAMVNEVFAYYGERKIDPGYQGHFEERYCAAFAEMMGGGYADAVATGTAAIYIALAALELPAGSEVLVSPITDPGTINAIILRGLIPRLCDSRPGSYNVAAEQVIARLSPQTSAVIVVHSAGQATEVDAIVAACHARGVRVLEDCSQAHGALWKDKPVGSFGDIAAFSTMYRKAHITGASGGVVFSRDKDLYHMALAHADRGKPRWDASFSDRDPSGYLFPALNLHTDELSCAVGLASLRRLPQTIAARLAYLCGLDALHQQSAVCRPYGWTKGDSPFFYPIVVNETWLRCDKRRFAEAVAAEGIGLNPHYMYLVQEWPWVRPYLADDFDCVNAKAIRDSSFNLFVNERYGGQELADTLAAIAKVEKVLAA